jgi:hypothetical protein
MSELIEFHDSSLTSVAFVGTSVRLDLRAYVHRWEELDGVLRGTGWIRPVRIILSEGFGDDAPELPVDLDGGVCLAEAAKPRRRTRSRRPHRVVEAIADRDAGSYAVA